MADNLCSRCGASNRDTAKFCADCGGPLLSGVSGASSPPAAPGPKMGTILQGRYQIEKELGRGGFGAVYKATDLNLHRPCAVKENLDTSQEAQRQFLREATVLANLSHPNLPRVTDHFQISGKGQYLVMDFVEGEDLAMIAERQDGKVAVEQAVEWIEQVADALVYLHGQTQPVLHRDIKPSNIRITPFGKAMLVDFGLVKFYSPHLKTTIGARAVTPGYAPPEQYGKGNTDARTDLYALGATLYAVLSGQEPPESVQRLAGDHLTPPSHLNPKVSQALDQVVIRSMALEPSQRYQNAVDFLSALKAAAKAAPVAATVVVSEPMPYAGASRGGVAETGAARPVSPPLQRPQPQAPQRSSAPVAREKSSNKMMLGLGIGIVLVLCLGVVGVAGGLMWSSQQADANDTATAAEKEVQQALALARTQTAEVEAEQKAGTATAGAPLTKTAAAQATIRSQADATQTERAGQTATAQALVEALERDWAEFASALGIFQTRTLIFGPVSGSLPHEDDQLVEVYDAEIDYADFVTEVVFENPYDTSVGQWDIGFLFRYADAYNNLRIVIDSDGTWILEDLAGNKDNYAFTDLEEGFVSNLDISSNGSNKVLLICQDSRGWLYLNNEFVTQLDLSVRLNSGDVVAGIGLFNGREVVGQTTYFYDFTVWSLP